MPSKIKDLSQQRARFAYTKVQEVVDESNGKEWAGEFKSHVKDVPMMIKTNGLAAAYAFVFSKSKKEDYKKITQITQKWLVEEQNVFELEAGKDLFLKMTELDRNQYRLAIREILALFTWLKRYAEGMIQN
jgi:CRISPR-associated protein Cmr5